MCLPFSKDKEYASFSQDVVEPNRPKSEDSNGLHLVSWFQEHLTKLILSGSLPKCISLSAQALKPYPNPLTREEPLRVRLFNGYTNECLRHYLLQGRQNMCGLVYASAGNIAGQLSNPYGTHFAQEEATVVENPHVVHAISQATQAAHGTKAADYPTLGREQVESLLQNNMAVYTPAVGFLVKDIYPLFLDSQPMVDIPFTEYFSQPPGHKARDEHENTALPPPQSKKNTISYIIQSALHFGYSMEDESTNFMLNLNPSVTSVEQLFALRKAVMQTTQNNREQRIALMTILFSAFPLENYCSKAAQVPALTTSNRNEEQDQHDMRQARRYKLSYADIYEYYSLHETEIRASYKEALEYQLRNQIVLLAQCGITTFITGLYGCGVYNHDYKDVAEAYGRVLAQYGGSIRELIIVNRITSENCDQMVDFCKIITQTINSTRNARCENP